MSSRQVSVKVADVVLDSRLQARVKADKSVIDDYVDAWKDGVDFPPITIVEVDGVKYVVDGFLRVSSALIVGKDQIRAVVSRGSWEDAVRAAVGANATHGARRSNEDKRKAVAMAFVQWPSASNRLIASIVRVSITLVGNIRSESGAVSPAANANKPSEKSTRAVRQQSREAKAEKKKTAAIVPVVSGDRIAASLADVAHVTACPECGGTDFALDDGGKTCRGCLRPIDPSDPPTAVAVDPVEASAAVDVAPAAAVAVAAGSVERKNARKAFGALVRALDTLGTYEACRPHLDEISRLIG